MAEAAAAVAVAEDVVVDGEDVEADGEAVDVDAEVDVVLGVADEDTTTLG